MLPFIGIYDLFSASLAADRFEALFLIGFGLAASAFGLPDIGFIGWVDATVASHVARTLERCGASGVVLEDQARPRRCGHLDGKQLLPLPEYLSKLEAVLADRSSLVVVTRTDVTDTGEILTRVQAFEQALDDLSDAGADLCGALASPRQMLHCNAVLQANLKRAEGA